MDVGEKAFVAFDEGGRADLFSEFHGSETTSNAVLGRSD
jgi:hypothetical protein